MRRSLFFATAGAAALLGGCEPSGSPAAAVPAGASVGSRIKPLVPPPEEAIASRLERLESGLDARDQRIRDLERALGARDAKIEELEKRIGELFRKHGEETQALEQEFARLRERDAATEARLDALSRVVDALRARSLVPNAARDVPRIVASVLSVERGAEVLLDKGSRHGVEPTFEFTIARAGRAIALVRVDRVEPEVAGARVVSVKEGEQIREGDTAVTKFQ
jgi:seryl-tRNA synthetase